MPVPYGDRRGARRLGLVQPAQRASHRARGSRQLRDRDDRHALRGAAPAALRRARTALDPVVLREPDRALRSRRPAASRRWELPIEPRGSETPYALHVERASGAVWICGTNSDTLIRFEPASERFTVYPLPTRVTYTREIAFDAQGRVWTSNSNSPAWQIEGGMPQVLRLDPDGEARAQPARAASRSAGAARLSSSARLRLAARPLRCVLALALAGSAAGRLRRRVDDSGPVAGWPAWGGDAGGSRHSPLTQITRENVGRLELAWRFHTGDVADGSRTRGKSVFEATPILDGDTLYFCSPFNRVFALDAETGAQRWVFDPKVELAAPLAAHLPRRRALERRRARRRPSPAGAGSSPGRSTARLLALDAEDGALCRDFGEGGSVDLTRGLGRVDAGRVRRHLSADTDRGRRGRRRAGRRRTAHGRAERRGARLRRAQRRAALGLRSGSARDAAAAARRGRHAALAPRNAERLVGLLRRSRARSPVRADGQREPGFLRRPAGRARSLLELAWSRCAARRARSSGASRPCTTISGTTTSRRSRR